MTHGEAIDEAREPEGGLSSDALLRGPPAGVPRAGKDKTPKFFDRKGSILKFTLSTQVHASILLSDGR